MELSPEIAVKLNNSKEGKHLKKFITSKVNSLDRISDIPDDWDKEQKAIEITARKRAAEKLAEILKPLIESEEVPEKEEPEIY